MCVALVRCAIQLPASGLEITDNSIFLEHTSSVVQEWKANISLWKCQTYTYSITSVCKSPIPNSCWKPQGTHRSHMGSYSVCALQVQGVQEVLVLLHVCFTAMYRHSCLDKGRKKYCSSISAFLYSLMQIKLSRWWISTWPLKVMTDARKNSSRTQNIKL